MSEPSNNGIEPFSKFSPKKRPRLVIKKQFLHWSEARDYKLEGELKKEYYIVKERDADGKETKNNRVQQNFGKGYYVVLQHKSIKNIQLYDK